MKTGQLKTDGIQHKLFQEESLQQDTLPQETRNSLNRQPNFTPKQLEKEEQTKKKEKEKFKISRRNHKFQSRNK